MSLKKIGQVKKDRFFKIGDLVIYGAIALIVAALFIAVALTSKGGALKGIEVYYGDELAFSYSFENKEYNIVMPENISCARQGDKLEVTFCTNGGSLEKPSSYNIIVIDEAAKSVSVTQSDCSNRKDCVHTSAMTSADDMIICAPHGLMILPLGHNDFSGSDGDDVLPVG